MFGKSHGRFVQITNEPHGILRLTLNDPARRNALSEAMLDHLWDAIQLAGDDASVRAVILRQMARHFVLAMIGTGRADMIRARPTLRRL